MQGVGTYGRNLLAGTAKHDAARGAGAVASPFLGLPDDSKVPMALGRGTVTRRRRSSRSSVVLLTKYHVSQCECGVSVSVHARTGGHAREMCAPRGSQLLARPSLFSWCRSEIELD